MQNNQPSLQVNLRSLRESASYKHAANSMESLAGVFDIDIAMENTGGDQQILGELIGSVLEETPRLMDRIRSAIAPFDRDSLRMEAHTLKGSVGMVGATDASDAAAKLESACGEGTAQQLHDDLQSRIDILLDALQLHCRAQGDV